jgi:hypothetical protein
MQQIPRAAALSRRSHPRAVPPELHRPVELRLLPVELRLPGVALVAVVVDVAADAVHRPAP